MCIVLLRQACNMHARKTANECYVYLHHCGLQVGMTALSWESVFNVIFCRQPRNFDQKHSNKSLKPMLEVACCIA
jgi:hypothetical protein